MEEEIFFPFEKDKPNDMFERFRYIERCLRDNAKITWLEAVKKVWKEIIALTGDMSVLERVRALANNATYAEWATKENNLQAMHYYEPNADDNSYDIAIKMTVSTQRMWKD